MWGTQLMNKLENHIYFIVAMCFTDIECKNRNRIRIYINNLDECMRMLNRFLILGDCESNQYDHLAEMIAVTRAKACKYVI